MRRQAKSREGKQKEATASKKQAKSKRNIRGLRGLDILLDFFPKFFFFSLLFPKGVWSSFFKGVKEGVCF